MKRLNQLADEIPIDLRELILGLDDEGVSEAQILPTNTTGLVDYSARANPNPLDFDIADLLKVEPNSEIRFSDLPIGLQLPMGVSEEGEFIETHSALNMAAPPLRVTVCTTKARGADVPNKALFSEFDNNWNKALGTIRSPEVTRKCVTEFYRKYFTACEAGNYDLAKHYLKEMSSC